MVERLDFQKLAWRLAVIAEVFYAACMLYGLLLTGPAQQLHQSLFDLLVGFSWTPVGILLGAIDMAVLAVIAAWVSVWLHDYSRVPAERTSHPTFASSEPPEPRHDR